MVAMGGAVVCALLVTGAVYLLYNGMIDAQDSRNAMLTAADQDPRSPDRGDQ